MKENEKVIPTCPKCSRKNVVFRVDGSLFCRSCGYDSKKEKQA